MGKKANNLKQLINDKFNVFNFKEINTYEELIDYSKDNSLFTMRFDRNDNFKSLPFYIFNNNDNKEEYFKNIIDEMNNLNCTIVCSNGLVYDENLKFNFVCELDNDNNFILEFCDKKVPLRNMYNYKTTVIKGNLYDTNYTYTNKFNNKYDDKDIDNILLWILNNKGKYKYFECTLYDIKVGILNDYIITWQTN